MAFKFCPECGFKFDKEYKFVLSAVLNWMKKPKKCLSHCLIFRMIPQNTPKKSLLVLMKCLKGRMSQARKLNPNQIASLLRISAKRQMIFRNQRKRLKMKRDSLNKIIGFPAFLCLH